MKRMTVAEARRFWKLPAKRRQALSRGRTGRRKLSLDGLIELAGRIVRATGKRLQPLTPKQESVLDAASSAWSPVRLPDIRDGQFRPRKVWSKADIPTDDGDLAGGLWRLVSAVTVLPDEALLELAEQFDGEQLTWPEAWCENPHGCLGKASNWRVVDGKRLHVCKTCSNWSRNHRGALPEHRLERRAERLAADKGWDYREPEGTPIRFRCVTCREVFPITVQAVRGGERRCIVCNALTSASARSSLTSEERHTPQEVADAQQRRTQRRPGGSRSARRAAARVRHIGRSLTEV